MTQQPTRSCAAEMSQDPPMASSQATTKPINSSGIEYQEKSLVTGNKRHALSERGHDVYETPPEAVRALLAAEDVPQLVWEPACGPGSIVKVLRESGRTVFATDIADYGCPDSWHSLDFLKWVIPTDGIRCIITNPPFKIIQQFIEKALEVCPKVIMLARLALLESDRRTTILENGRLARVHVFRKRLPMMHRHGWEGNKVSSAMAFAWFVWEGEWSKPTELRRLSWER